MSDKPVILVVDDDKNTRDGLQRALQRHYAVKTAESAEAALAILGGEAPVDVMLSDLRMPGTDGLGLLRRVNAQHPQTVCILLTAYGSVETAVEAMKQGAYDFLTKPINLDHLDMLVARALKSRDLEKKVETLESQLNEKFGMENIIGESQAMKQVFEVIQQTAPTQASVLIQGPSGTGKELLARAVHQGSARRNGPFVAVNCGELPDNLLESELFGYKKGAFTDARTDKPGRFALAEGGTLFLDEIGDTSPAMQVKLLRVLQERVYEPLGATQPAAADVRVIAATNRDLAARVAEGGFRADLYYRINVISFELPPLAERPEDIPLLVAHFVEALNAEQGRSVRGLAPAALERLMRYGFPGNIRELRNIIERAYVLCRCDEIPESCLPPHLLEGGAAKAPAHYLNLRRLPPAEERAAIEATLRACGGRRKETAARLDIDPATLWRKMKRCGLS